MEASTQIYFILRNLFLSHPENEPKLKPGFLELKNVVLAPHIASSSKDTRLKMAMLTAQNLVAAFTGKTPPNLLNPEIL